MSFLGKRQRMGMMGGEFYLCLKAHQSISGTTWITFVQIQERNTNHYLLWENTKFSSEAKGKLILLGANSIPILANKAKNFKCPIRFKIYTSLFWRWGKLHFPGGQRKSKSLDQIKLNLHPDRNSKRFMGWLGWLYKLEDLLK